MSTTRVPWLEKTFASRGDAADRDALVERLRDVPDRVRLLVRGLPAHVLTRRDGDAWSIQEHAGHLWDLEDLHRRRLRDYRAGARELRPADLSNRRTRDACHNDDDLDSILEDFRFERGLFLEEIAAMPAAAGARAPLHPRLRLPMTVVDLMRFVAGHDEHHLERMRDLVARFAR